MHMAELPYSCVLWDVDGTIADASAGILPRLVEVFAAFGRPAPDPATLPSWIGPPMFESFCTQADMASDEAERAVALYRELAARDGYAAAVRIYPGITAVLEALSAAGVPQATASSKPENQVQAILEHYGLLRAFVVAAGALPDTPGNRDNKTAVIGRALDRLTGAGVDVSRPVLIGDRHHDITGAAPYGIPVIFATWGFGEEQESAGSVALASSPEQLLPLLLP